ncbi:hypothetical protein M8J77_014440 [Diaphorina citri]|nr:hypothetical protein M8J77_014440 [Diaphorina citri]
MDTAGWFVDKKRDTALKVYNKDVKVYETGNGDGFVWIVTNEVQIFSCYISPNVPLPVFVKFLDGLKLAIRASKCTKYVVGGDFNSKSFYWNARKEDDRGTILSEWAAEMDLEIVNRGNKPTFVRGESNSIIDITMCSQNLWRKITDWRVTDDETMSHHQYIFYTLMRENGQEPTEIEASNTWKYNETKKEKFMEELKKKVDEERTNAEDLIKILQETCNEIFGANKKRDGRRPVYWWTKKIAELRRKCHAQKRKMTRTNKRRSSTDREKEDMRLRYYELKRKLRQEIEDEKKRKWKELCEDLNRNVWGDAYRIVCKKFKLLPSISLKPEEKRKIAEELFPTDEKMKWKREEVRKEDIQEFTMEEVYEAIRKLIRKLRNKKAPGSDGLGGEVIKIMFETAPNLCRKLFNQILTSGEFPKNWKNAKLVLLEKGIKDGTNKMAYRPICLINVIGKTMEHLLKGRLLKEIKEKGGIAENQYGFTEGKSTVDAMEEVVKMAEEARRKRKICAMVLVDVKNAFNSIPWKGILEEVKKRGISGYLVNILSSYLEDRELLVDDLVMDLSCGVPQGSVIGPLLWNLYYDPMLRMELPGGSKLVAYADDVVVITTGIKKDEVESTLNRTMKTLVQWLDEHKLKIAPQKTEIVLLVTKKECKEIEIKVEDTEVKSKESAKYLGVYFEQSMAMRTHIKKAVEKAGRTAGNLARLMPNLKGPENEKRQILATVVYSALLYGVPIWGKIIKWKKYVNMMEKVQRKVMLRLARAYRTVATGALQVISGSLPIELMIEERMRTHEIKKQMKEQHNRDGEPNIEEMREQVKEKIEEIREEMMDKWKEKWTNEQKGKWTKRLINDLKKWVNRKHGHVTYELCQFLTGNGHFRRFQYRIKKVSNMNCIYCESDNDSAEHTVFECEKFEEERKLCEDKEGKLTPDNIIEIMLKNEESWKNVETMVKKIINKKEEDNRKRSQAPR